MSTVLHVFGLPLALRPPRQTRQIFTSFSQIFELPGKSGFGRPLHRYLYFFSTAHWPFVAFTSLIISILSPLDFQFELLHFIPFCRGCANNCLTTRPLSHALICHYDNLGLLLKSSSPPSGYVFKFLSSIHCAAFLTHLLELYHTFGTCLPTFIH